MCGISGFADFNNLSSKQTVAAMALAQQHRGPDGEGFYFVQRSKYQVGLSHRRLAIVDLSNSSGQPMFYKGLHLVFNGEIYNYKELREELIKKGHQFVTHGDAEVILHSWKEWGESAIQRWHGMFAIALYDEAAEALICIRDRAGVKPFYYYFHNGLFLFGSELKSLRAHPFFKPEICRAAVASFLQYGYVSAPYAIYQNCWKIKPGHLLRVDLLSKEIKQNQYWNVYTHYNKPKRSISFFEAKVETESVLSKAFNYRMVADVPVGVFLSGGFDSACVTALLQKDRTEKIKTFTIGSADKYLDEAPFAKKVATHFGTDHTEYYCTANDTMDIISELPYYYDEPFGDSSAIPTLLVSRMARKEVKVVLSADAGDEIFAGYNRYDYLIRFGGKLNAVPKAVRKSLAGVMKQVSSAQIPYFGSQPLFHSRYQKIRNLLHDPSPAGMLQNLSQVFSNAELDDLFVSPVSAFKTAHISTELEPQYFDPLSYMMAVDYQTYLADDVLQKVDRATMAVGLEGREPFIDHQIIEWAASLPSDFKYHKGEKKYILKQIVYKYIPPNLMDRKKMGFGIPVAQWLRNELKDTVREHLTGKSLAVSGLFNASYVERLISAFLNGRTELHLKVWYLLQFQMWYRYWMQ